MSRWCCRWRSDVDDGLVIFLLLGLVPLFLIGLIVFFLVRLVVFFLVRLVVFIIGEVLPLPIPSLHRRRAETINLIIIVVHGGALQ
jgi:hypothetical protein